MLVFLKYKGNTRERGTAYELRPKPFGSVTREYDLNSIKELWANPAYLDHLTYAPERCFTDEGKVERIYDELMSGDWSWEAQVRGSKCFFGNVLIVLQTLLPDGATLVPVILSSDKTKLCQF
jgi:hypothetical protein